MSGAIGASVVATSIVATSIVVAVPASAIEGDYATATTVAIAGDLHLQSIRYGFRADDAPVSPGPHAEPGPSSTSSSATWTLGGLGSSELRSQMIGRIVDFDKTTDYWVRVSTQVTNIVGTYTSSCEVFLGDPEAGGTVLDQESASPYRCFSSHLDDVFAADPIRVINET